MKEAMEKNVKYKIEEKKKKEKKREREGRRGKDEKDHPKLGEIRREKRRCG